jgi:hypothetical protein
MSSLLIKDGIADAWSGEPESRRQIETSLAAAGMGAPTLAVSRSYLDRFFRPAGEISRNPCAVAPSIAVAAAFATIASSRQHRSAT